MKLEAFELIQIGFRGKDPGVIHVRKYSMHDGSNARNPLRYPMIKGSKALCGHVFENPRILKLDIELLITDVDIMKHTCLGCMEDFKVEEFMAV